MTRPPWWSNGAFASGDGAEATLRRDAGLILRAGLAAVEPEPAVIRALERRAASIEAARRVCILAIGKAADAMTRGALAALGDRVAEGVIVASTPGDPPVPRIRRMCGDHPIPGPASLEAGAAVRDFATAVAEGDVVVCLVSGGASALAIWPEADIALPELAGLIAELLRSGASIGELNAVRRRLDRLKGGGLASLLAPARTIGLLLSDVPDDRLADIGSGPLVADPTTATDALAVLERRRLLDRVSPALRRALEAERSDPPGVDLEIIGSAAQARSAAAAAARDLGYEVTEQPGHVTGEARAVGESLGERIARGSGRRAILLAGETTVTVRGPGRGGRNQEVALGAVAGLSRTRNALVAAMGTDGIDGPTNAAGAVATSSTAARAAEARLDAAAALEANDAYGFFDGLGDLIRSGPTGTNVMDLYLALADG